MLLLMITGITQIKAQTGRVGIGTTTPHASAVLDIRDTTKGILIPRMTFAQRNRITTPTEGLMIYQVDSTRGFWYYNGTGWMSFNTSPNYGGKTIIAITDSITNAQAQLQLLQEFGPNTQELRIQGCVNLTSIDLSMFTKLVNINITDNSKLLTINFPNLVKCDGYFNIAGCSRLNTINLPALEAISFMSTGAPFYALSIVNNLVTTFQAPKLNRITGPVTFGSNRVLRTISFPVLRKVGNVKLESNALTTLNVPVLEEMLQLYIQSELSCTTLAFPSLKTMYNFVLYNTPRLTSFSMPLLSKLTLGSGATSVIASSNLTTFELGNLTQFSNAGIGVSGKLSSNDVNRLLANFNAITPAIRNRDLNFIQNPPAPPTGQGLIDKAALIANGNIVRTN